MADPKLLLTNLDGSPNPQFTDALAAHLTSSNALEACFGRCVAAGISDAVVAWSNAELERGTEPAAIMVSLIELQIQQVASLAGNFVSAAGADVVRDHYRTLLDAQFTDHAQRVRQALAASTNTEQTR